MAFGESFFLLNRSVCHWLYHSPIPIMFVWSHIARCRWFGIEKNLYYVVDRNEDNLHDSYQRARHGVIIIVALPCLAPPGVRAAESISIVCSHHLHFLTRHPSAPAFSSLTGHIESPQGGVYDILQQLPSWLIPKHDFNEHLTAPVPKTTRASSPSCALFRSRNSRSIEQLEHLPG